MHTILKRCGMVAWMVLAAMLVSCTGQVVRHVGKKPVKVFLMAGQSNMEGYAEVRTIDFLGEDPDPKRSALLKVFKPDGRNLVTRDDVWVASGGVYDKLQPGFGARKDLDHLSTRIGPEYPFGYYMGEALEEQVLLIKVAEGGTTLYQNWRPPSAGVPEGIKAEECGELYRTLVDYTKSTLKDLKKHFPDYDESAGYEIAGFVWFHGFNDMLDDTPRKQYARNLTCLIKDLRRDLDAPGMRVVVGVMGINGVRNEVGKQQEMRDAHRSMNSVAEFKGNVKAIETAHLLTDKIVELNCPGGVPPGEKPRPGRWLYPERDIVKSPITPEEQAMLNRATSHLSYHYYGEGRFFILLGKSLAEAMQELIADRK